MPSPGALSVPPGHGHCCQGGEGGNLPPHGLSGPSSLHPVMSGAPTWPLPQGRGRPLPTYKLCSSSGLTPRPSAAPTPRPTSGDLAPPHLLFHLPEAPGQGPHPTADHLVPFGLCYISPCTLYPSSLTAEKEQRGRRQKKREGGGEREMGRGDCFCLAGGGWVSLGPASPGNGVHAGPSRTGTERASSAGPPERPGQPSGCCVLGFDWSLHFQWEQLSPEQKAQRLDPSEPIR